MIEYPADDEGEEKEDAGHRRGIAHFKPDKCVIVQMGHNGMPGIIGAGHTRKADGNLKDRKAVGDNGDGAEQHLRLELRDGEIDQLLHTVADAVDEARFVHLCRRVLQAGPA